MFLFVHIVYMLCLQANDACPHLIETMYTVVTPVEAALFISQSLSLK